MILEEFDEEKRAIINPDSYENKVSNFPKIGITCFSQKLMDKYIEALNGKKIAEVRNANGATPVYKIRYNDTDIALFTSRVGAPACTVAYEELIAMGLEKLIMFGTCGSLDNSINDLAIIIPTAAIRDEGTSYHYVKSSEEIDVNKKYRTEFKEILKNQNISSIEGKVWTTDAPYRETEAKKERRKEQGCICVDMECSAMAAVAEFRNKELFQYFYAADNLDGAEWEERSLGNDSKLSEKEKIIYPALERVKKMNK